MSIQLTQEKDRDFYKYLEKAGAVEHLTKVLVSLFEEEERPKDDEALMYILSMIQELPAGPGEKQGNSAE